MFQQSDFQCAAEAAMASRSERVPAEPMRDFEESICDAECAGQVAAAPGRHQRQTTGLRFNPNGLPGLPALPDVDTFWRC